MNEFSEGNKEIIIEHNSVECHKYFLFFLITTNNCTINITTISLFIIYTPTCFDISMLSSGSFIFVTCPVTYILKSEAVKIGIPQNDKTILKFYLIVF
jgi:hypothetical protein